LTRNFKDCFPTEIVMLTALMFPEANFEIIDETLVHRVED
jgi:hypothetical protein